MHQPMAIDPESSGAVELLIDSGGATEKGPNVTIRKVRVDAVTSIHFTYILDFSGARYPSQKLTSYRWELRSSFSVDVICRSPFQD